jgi:hypothetical protein
VTDHGPRLSGEEYERRLVALQRQAPAMPTREEDRALRRRALELAIDHRLGRAFPAERRQALWEAAERVEARRLRSGFRVFLGRLLGGTRAPGEALARALAREYGRVLDADELARFLGTPPSPPPRP